MPRRSPSFTAPEDSAGFLLWRTANLWQRRQREALAPLGLTPVQLALLAGVVALSKEGTPVSQVRLARHARADVMMTSQVLRTLQRKKLIRRVPHATDPRANALLPSAAGRRLARQAIAALERTDSTFFAPLGGDAQRLAGMLRALGEGEAAQE
jgi:DNA-binding MarR family transcriptional regulator